MNPNVRYDTNAWLFSYEKYDYLYQPPSATLHF